VSVRLRLTLLYSGLFLLAGALLLLFTLGLVRSTFDLPFTIPIPAPADSPGRGVFVLIGPGVLGATPPGQDAAGGTVAAPTPKLLASYRRKLDDAVFQQLASRFGIALAVMALGSVGLGWVVAGRVLHPLHQLTATAKRLSDRNLHERINLDGPKGELKELADTFDAMLARLDAAFDSQRRFVANASHELRTPLAIARTELDVTLASRRAGLGDFRSMAERVRDATERSERLIESLLLLAASEREPRVHEPVDLAEAAAEALAQQQAGIARLGLHLTEARTTAPVAGDRPLLERLVANLVENAVRHNQPAGWVEVATGAAAGRAEIMVSNGGQPIPADQVDSLFEPFHRLGGRAGANRGAGLGLSIVRAVASAHGGTVAARALPHGGLEVTVRLPARPAERDGSA
jgi:signal transduction histidine kinase